MKLNAVGADVELFLQDDYGNPITAIRKFGGTKQNPKPMSGMPQGFFIQEDNVMAEFNIPPANNMDDFHSNIHNAVNWIEGVVKQKELHINIASLMKFKLKQLQSTQARHVGCEPDYDVWTMEENPRVNSDKLKDIRTCGGHIHITTDDSNMSIDETLNLIKACDYTIGIASVFWESDSSRKEHGYGMAGAFRFKEYGPSKWRGVEYRTPSNFWVSGEFPKLIFQKVESAIALASNTRFQDVAEHYKQVTINAINKHLKDDAFNIRKQMLKLFPNEYNAVI
jgi:hypothetical protein